MTTGKKILLVDDDDGLRDSLSEQLRLHEEFLTAEAATAAEALETTKGEYFDAVILDVGLPDMDGREVCRLMRRNGVKSPIIMLTGQDTDADQILGLDAGANDYVTGRQGRQPRHIARRGVGLQRWRYHPHAGNPRLSLAAKNGSRFFERDNPCYRARRIPLGPLEPVPTGLDPSPAASWRSTNPLYQQSQTGRDSAAQALPRVLAAPRKKE